MASILQKYFTCFIYFVFYFHFNSRISSQEKF